MRVLVTGASGYVGRVVVGQLLRRGHEPVGLAHRAKPDIEGVIWRHGDVRDIASLRAATEDVDAVIHLSALAGVRKAFERPVRYYQTNAAGVLNLLEVLSERRAGPSRLVAASTVSVYGVPVRQPITEETPADPRNPYAASKVAAEQAIGWTAAAGAIGAVTLRVANVAGGVGPHGDRDDSRLITRACAVAAGRIPELDVYGDGGAVRDFVHVLDAAGAFVAAVAECEPGHHRVFNIGATAARVTDVVAMTRSVTGRDVPVRFHPSHPGEVRELRTDTSKAREELSWRPRYSNLARLVADQWHAEIGPRPAAPPSMTSCPSVTPNQPTPQRSVP
ncbi:NAD-dependent epimerase/dehydratase family protein [Amycolatopsis pigmentata]|uniref:UDP-glucose 4-epimerase n=1 Tax=Amycolatopsis pigmentata TaxID=450801 RepID=A0ABW5FSB9_9PSEU